MARKPAMAAFFVCIGLSCLGTQVSGLAQDLQREQLDPLTSLRQTRFLMQRHTRKAVLASSPAQHVRCTGQQHGVQPRGIAQCSQQDDSDAEQSVTRRWACRRRITNLLRRAHKRQLPGTSCKAVLPFKQARQSCVSSPVVISSMSSVLVGPTTISPACSGSG